MIKSLLVSLALIASSVLAAPAANSTCSPTALSCSSSASTNTCCSPKYGLVVLVQQWVPGYGPSNAFTLHGLWPDKCDGTYAPSGGCDSARQWTNIETIVQNNGPSTLHSDLVTYWPSDAQSNNAFWSHEWDKHGTCVSTYAPSCYGSSYTKYQDVVDYFTKVLELRAKYDLYTALSNANITPGGSYSVSAMQAAIRTAYGVTPKIDCSSGTLIDIYINFLVQGTSTYVPQDTSGSTCKGTVNYPSK
uniref:ribonuclease T2 n=1 Tax=Umbelopsis ovata TaxID=201723 RepID=M5B0M3_9FUNG|nr:ribonuclease T2 [Umbelopsis ovata]BAN14452.1 ribonuclease T2 [Umbelopsis ovata]